MRGLTDESTGGRLRRYLTAIWSVAAVFALTMFATRYVQMDISAVYLAAVMFSAWSGGLLWKVEPQAPFITAGVIGVVGTIVFAATVEERYAG